MSEPPHVARALHTYWEEEEEEEQVTHTDVDCTVASLNFKGETSDLLFFISSSHHLGHSVSSVLQVPSEGLKCSLRFCLKWAHL